MKALFFNKKAEVPSQSEDSYYQQYQREKAHYQTGKDLYYAKAYAAAASYFTRAASFGDPRAMCNLGLMYEHGLGVPKNIVTAAKHYCSAAKLGNITAQRNLDEMSTNAYKAQDADAIEFYRVLAEQGHAEAQFNLGSIYYNGKGVAQDDVQAVVWYRKAAEQGHASAQYMLGSMYSNGRGVPKDDAQAVTWYRKASEQGHAGAQNKLGASYAVSRGVTQNDVQAVAWNRKAAEQGHAGAQYMLGAMCEEGRGAPKDKEQAVAWYRKAAEQGHAKARFDLGVMYEKGRGVPKDDAQAAAWYRKAAEQGHAEAQYKLGVMCREGFDMPQNDADAASWFQKAAEQGHAAAQNWLGIFYQKGRGVPQNDAKAVAWFRKASEQGHMPAEAALKAVEAQQAIRKAAEQGHANAQYNLGNMYRNGQGVPKDDAQAVAWYRKAAEQGYANAQCNLGFMYDNGRGVGKNYQQALHYYQLAIQQKLDGAQYAVGVLYEHGLGVEKNLSTAIQHFELAHQQNFLLAKHHISSLQGNVEAQLLLGQIYEEGRKIKSDDGSAWNIEKNLTLARHYYQLAANQGNQQAQRALNKLTLPDSDEAIPPPPSVPPPPLSMPPLKSSPPPVPALQSRPRLASGVPHREPMTAPKRPAPVFPSAGTTPSLSITARRAAAGGRTAALASRWETLNTSSATSDARPKLKLKVFPSASPSRRPAGASVKLPSAPALRGKTAVSLSNFEIGYTQITQLDQRAPLGQGAFGVVYRAQWQYQPVAVKTLLVSKFTPQDEQEFRSEVAINAGLRHPNITTFYGACTQSPHYCLVMEYMPKGSLYTLLHNTPPSKITWEQRYTWARDIGAGLAYLHDRGMIHRDLKSLNVLLDDRLRAKLADFGLATTKQCVQVASSLGSAIRNKHLASALHLAQAGTNRWKAPELFKRKAKHSNASDVYAFGCVLWEIASHKVPFENERHANDGMIAMWVRDGERDDIPHETPPGYGRLISRCWAQRVTERPTVAQAMHALTQASASPDNRAPSGPHYEDTLDSMRSGLDYDSVTASQMSRR